MVSLSRGRPSDLCTLGWVTVGPVNWGSNPGELLESVMAVLLFQVRPNASRRVPSQGDGGVDVVEPVEGGYHVYQIKKFAQRLTVGQKAQIKRSLNHVITDPRLDKPVVKWSLVMPLDPTSEEEAWFRELVVDAPFPVRVVGPYFWESEAAENPVRHDYYRR